MPSNTQTFKPASSKQPFKQPPLFKAWVICITASLLFFYEFIQINIMNSLNPFLASDLHMSAMSISTISSVYFLTNMLLLSVAGLLLDRYSTKLLIIIAMCLCTLGTFLFGLAHSMLLFLIARILIGSGGAFCFLGAFRIATRWFIPARLSQITGTIVTMAMIGGLVGQQPAVILIQHVGWRHTLFYDALLGIIFTLLIAIIVKDSPCKIRSKQDQQQAKVIGVWQSAKQVLSKGQIWLAALYGCLLNLVIYVIGALWGLRYLTDTHHVSIMAASHISGFILIGSIFGCPLIGALGDYTKHKRALMFFSALATLAAMLSLICFHQTILTLCVIFFCLGFFSSAQVMAYPHAAKQVIPAIQTTATSIISTCMLGSTALMQPIFAWLLVMHNPKTQHPPVYHYNNSMIALAVCLGISVLLSLIIDIHNKKQTS